jgi:hypothetical protein
MHRELCHQLLAEEVATVNRGHLGKRLPEDVRLEGTRVLVSVQADDCKFLLALDGPNYNAEPLHLHVLDEDGIEVVEEDGWPAGLRFGSPHPVLGGAWCCLRGLAQYYVHSSHCTERWDAQRPGLRLEVLLGQLLDRMKVPK